MKRVLSVLLVMSSMIWVSSLQAANERKKGSLNIPSTVIYALPKTVVDVQVVARKTILKRGPFAQYAEKFLGITENVVLADGQQWQILTMKLGSYPQVDPQQFHKIVASGDYEPNLVSLTPEGLIRGFNIRSGNQLRVEKMKMMLSSGDDINMDYGRFSIDPIAKEKNDTTYKVVETDTAFVKVPVLEKQYSLKTTEEKAAEAAHQIFKLRKRRFKILTANFEVLPPDGKAYEVLVRELAKLEQDYLSMFVGKRVAQEQVFHFSYIPKKGESSGVACRFSSERGVVDSKDLSGRPVMIELTDLKVTGKIPDFPVSEGENPDHQIVYRIPGQASVKLLLGKKQLTKRVMTISQLFKVSKIPSAVLLNEGYGIEFHEELGSISNIIKQ